jgi:hypothetical protein
LDLVLHSNDLMPFREVCVYGTSRPVSELAHGSRGSLQFLGRLLDAISPVLHQGVAPVIPGLAPQGPLVLFGQAPKSFAYSRGLLPE